MINMFTTYSALHSGPGLSLYITCATWPGSSLSYKTVFLHCVLGLAYTREELMSSSARLIYQNNMAPSWDNMCQWLAELSPSHRLDGFLNSSRIKTVRAKQKLPVRQKLLIFINLKKRRKKNYLKSHFGFKSAIAKVLQKWRFWMLRILLILFKQ